MQLRRSVVRPNSGSVLRQRTKNYLLEYGNNKTISAALLFICDRPFKNVTLILSIFSTGSTIVTLIGTRTCMKNVRQDKHASQLLLSSAAVITNVSTYLVPLRLYFILRLAYVL